MEERTTAKDELLTNEDENLEIVESTSEEQDEPVEVILKFNKPFVFEGKTYN